MARKRKNDGWFGEEADGESFDESELEPVAEFAEEDMEEFGELFDEVEVEPEVEIEPEPAAKQSTQNGIGRLKVTSLRAWVYPEPDIFTEPVGGVARGNLIVLLDANPLIDADGKRQWYEVEIRRVEGPIHGYIETTRVMEIR